MLGLVIPCKDRPEYLSECLTSLSAADLSGCRIVIVDDKSDNTATSKLIHQFHHADKIWLPKNQGVSNALLAGFDYLTSIGCNVLMNLDSDTVVKPDFITVLLSLQKKFRHQFISGFNSTTLMPGGSPRYPIISEGDGYIFKSCVGGCNMVASVSLYEKYWKRCLQDTSVLQPGRFHFGHWDQRISKLMESLSIPFVVAKPGAVQHIGIHSSLGHNLGQFYCKDDEWTTPTGTSQGNSPLAISGT